MTTNGYVPSALKVSPRALPDVSPDDHEVAKGWLRPALKTWCERTVEGVEQGERTAMNNYARVMGMIGAEREVNINLATTQVWGMPADEVQRIIEAHRQSSATTIEQCLEDGVALLMFVFEQEPHMREAARARLFGGGNGLALAETNGTHGTGTDQAT